MNAASPTAPSFDLDGLKRLAAFLFVFGVFYIGENHILFYKQISGGGDPRNATAVIDAAVTGTGSSLRPLMFGLLGMFGAVCWMARPAGLRTSIHGALPVLVFAFIVYVGFSVLWAVEQELVIRRVITFMLLCVAAFGIVHRFSNRDLVLLGFLSGGIIGIMSLGSEIISGQFNPTEVEFRLFGIMHANSLGGVMAVFVLSALALRQTSERHRFWYSLAIVFGLGILLLTKSRSSIAGLLAAMAIWIVLGARDRRRVIVLGIFALALIGPMIVFLFGEELASGVRKTVLLGRDSRSPETFTGRIPLWEYLIARFVEDRPLFGYGFQGFWTPDHILNVSASQDWLILHAHSGFMNIVLDLGLFGLGLFMLILIFAIGRAYAIYRATQDRTWLFITAVLTWAAVGSFFDNVLMSSTLRDFICMLAFAKVALFDPRYVRVRQPAYA
jgi:exopolysaccharide production protein ExoQ